MNRRDGLRTCASIILLLVFLTSCTPITSTLTITPSPSATSDHQLIYPTAVPTRPDFTITPTKWLDPTPVPTPTPKFVTPLPSGSYSLVEWGPDDAEHLIDELISYPESLDMSERGMYDTGYYYAFRFAALAQAEAAYRFPDYERAESWKWRSAYNQLQSFQNNIGLVYSELILDGLNTNETLLDNLKNWFESKEPRLEFESYPLHPLAGYLSSQIVLVKVRNGNVSGGTYIWLVESVDGFHTYSLESATDYGTGVEISIAFEDLTGDSTPEALISHVDWGSFNMHSGYLEVFDLSSYPPTKLSFTPEPIDMEIADWYPWIENDKHVGVRLQIPIYKETGGCLDFGPTWDYRWNGNAFELQKFELPSEEEMQSVPNCADYLVASELVYYLRNGILQALPTLITSLETYPRSADEMMVRGVPHPSLDEVIFEVGLVLANLGNYSEAVEEWQKLVMMSESSWKPLAQIAIDTIRSDPNMLSLCLALKNCNDFFSVYTMAYWIPSNLYLESINIFTEIGVPIIESGMYDFDRDGLQDPWFVWERPWEYYQFDAFVIDNGHMVPIFFPYTAGIYDLPGQVQITVQSQTQYATAYKITTGNPMQSLNISVQKFGISLPETTGSSVTELGDKLFFEGQSIEEFTNSLLVHPIQYTICTQYCDENLLYEYLLALSYELQGDEQEAVNRYYALWTSYPDSLYARMAAAKLKLLP